MQQNEAWLTSAAASRLGEINIVLQPVSNEPPVLERGVLSTASLGQRESTRRGTHTLGSCPASPGPSASPKEDRTGLPWGSALKGAPIPTLTGAQQTRRMSCVWRTAVNNLEPTGQIHLLPVL